MVSNEEIKKQIVETMYWDSRVDASQINVTVTNGKVLLTGFVPTFTAKVAAGEDTILVEGVKFIQNNLEVSFPKAITVPEDSELLAMVGNALLYHPDLEDAEVNLEISKGAVVLSGNVSEYWKKAEVELTVYRVKGVWNVVNLLSIVPTDKIEDKMIADKIVASLTRMSDVKGEEVHVKVENGVVTLSGEVNNWIGYKEAENAASFTPGVVKIKNNLRIKENDKRPAKIRV